MGCQPVGVRKGRVEGLRWTVVLKLELFVVLLVQVVAVVSAVSVGDNSVGFGGKQGFGLRRMPYKSLSVSSKQQPQRRLKQTGNEIIPAVASNDITEEPTCDELRAMWRYYKRQSRAELTNEISQFGKNPFFEMFPTPPRNPVVASFGITGKGRSRSRMRPAPSNPLYGRVVYKPSKQRERGRNRNQKPFETLRGLVRNPSDGSGARESGQGRVNGAAPAAMAAETTTTTALPPSAIVHYSPPAHPTKESSFMKLRGIIQGERMREKGPTRVSTGGGASTDNRDFGKIILSPPRGQDGRRINKPLEQMTAFERIRFGHADDLLDEGIRPNLDVMKRRTLPLSVLKTQWKQQHQQQPPQKRRFLSNPMLFLTPSSPNDGGGTSSRRSSSSDAGAVGQTTTFTGSNYFEKRAEENNNNNIIAPENDKQQLDSFYESQNVPSQLHEDNPRILLLPNNNNNNNGAYTDSIVIDDETSSTLSKISNPAIRRQPVELPTCAEVEHEPCNQTLDCSCIGFALYRCYFNQCQILPLAYSVQDELVPSEDDADGLEEDTSSSSGGGDIWHSEPLPSDKLGIWQEPIVMDTTSTGADATSGGGGGDGNSVSTPDAAARLNSIRARKNSKNEGNPSNRLTDSTYLVLQGQNLYT